MDDIKLDVVAFDLDGTLADTAPDLTFALNRTLDELGRPSLDAETVRNMVGHGARALLRKGLAATGDCAEELVDQAVPLYLAHYEANICTGTRVYDGLEAALNELERRGIAAAICTNKPAGLTDLLLDALGWQGRFRSVIGADTLPVRKPDPAPLLEAISRAGGGRAAFVGDSITDADTARAAQVPMIAVSFGFSDRPVEDLGADLVIDHYDELIPALMRLSAGGKGQGGRSAG